MNLKLVVHILSAFIVVLGVAMVLPLLVSVFVGGGDWWAFLTSALITIIGGTAGWLFTRTRGEPMLKDGFLIVTFTWILFSLAGALPFWLSGAIPSYIDALFESASGFTTTGASILSEIDSLPAGILFWRSFIQWLGGMGIVVFSIAILPLLGVGGMQLFQAEVPGPTADKITPRVKHTAMILWGTYSALTLLETLLLWAGPMSLFDAINHAFTTMATGGFSTHGASIRYFQSTYVNLIITLFMILAGTNFLLHVALVNKRFKKVKQDDELKFYLGTILVFALIISGSLVLQQGLRPGRALEHGLFATVSLMTTTGYGTLDFNLWPPLTHFLLLTLMFIGGMAGSTGGGIKVVRIHVFIKKARYSMRRMLHPNALFPIKLGRRLVADSIVDNIIGFVILYMLIQMVGTYVVAAFGYDLVTSFSAVLASLSNVGPGLALVGPAENFGFFHPLVKVLLAFCMIIGRLELFTVLVIFTRGFWKI